MGHPAGGQGQADRCDDRCVDRVQHLNVTGDRKRLREEVERIFSTNRTFKKVGWSASKDVLVAKSGLGMLVWRQTVTVQFANEADTYSDLWVCSQAPQLIDYGINKRNLTWFADALVMSGFGVTSGPMETSWRKSSRPVAR